MNETPRSALACARAGAEAIRALNHATLTPGPEAEFEYPADACAVVGALVELAARLPQAIDQVHDLIRRSNAAGELRHDSGNPADFPVTLAALVGAAEWSRDNADLLHTSLSDMHNTLARLGHTGGDDPW
ncbi:hypothetical protein [Streptomyces sp. SBT349]|uniref:hypothetical protein n=1 Tax=Streptomyces sp. SBT349 TaxID=1580539 RepID=UPI00066A5401|nr:hypothetical protein [Streptomyces sp. SBT349]